jgi:hypothetical protein
MQPGGEMDTKTSEPSEGSDATFCNRYEKLLADCQKALQIWSNRREQAWQMGLRGKELGGELVRLQADFAKSYAVLQKHKRQCVLCEIVARLADDYSHNLHLPARNPSLPA